LLRGRGPVPGAVDMSKIRIIVVDRTRDSFLKEGEEVYLSRLRNYAPVEWIQVKPAKISKGRNSGEILGEEAREIKRYILPRDYLIALDRTGRQYDSEELAVWLEGLFGKATGPLSFVIGGPLGLSRQITSQAGIVLSLSRLTLTHEMTRLILLEQLYRAFTILRGEKYHK
jgi:23S rRNA (pseudouridine1915-N3)-methyltransferase